MKLAIAIFTFWCDIFFLIHKYKMHKYVNANLICVLCNTTDKEQL